MNMLCLKLVVNSPPRLQLLLQLLILITAVTRGVTSCADGPLGMSNGDIKDWQITASSTYPTSWDPTCHEKHSRLYLDNGKAWCAKHRSDSEWLQIDLGVAAKVCTHKHMHTIFFFIFSFNLLFFYFFILKT